MNLKDEEIVIIKDKYPVAEHHILVLSKRHIVNSKCLKTDDLSLGKLCVITRFKCNFKTYVDLILYS